VSIGLYLILAVILTGFVISLLLIKYWLSQKPGPDPILSEWLKSSTGQINHRLDSATELMASVQKNLGEMSEIGRGLKSLQEFLQNPKLRGGLGEQVLGEMIGQTFPKNAFHLQYSFKSGVKVDAVLKTDAGILCIDSKFPLENFQALVKGEPGAKTAFLSDVKKHIISISQKYILPEENTTDFALMFIPSESVYYEVVNTPELMKLAQDQRVYPVSPNTLYAHLQVLLLSFQGKDLEAKSREVFKLLQAIQKDYAKTEENLSVLNRHLTNAYNQMGNVTTQFSTLGQKLSRTHQLSGEEKTKLKGPET
jgi:DNA recombination protein RmuC